MRRHHENQRVLMGRLCVMTTPAVVGFAAALLTSACWADGPIPCRTSPTWVIVAPPARVAIPTLGPCPTIVTDGGAATPPPHVAPAVAPTYRRLTPAPRAKLLPRPPLVAPAADYTPLPKPVLEAPRLKPAPKPTEPLDPTTNPPPYTPE